MKAEDKIERALAASSIILDRAVRSMEIAASMPRDTPEQRDAYLRAIAANCREGADELRPLVDEPPEPTGRVIRLRNGSKIRIAMTPVGPCDWLERRVIPDASLASRWSEPVGDPPDAFPGTYSKGGRSWEEE